MIKKTPRIAIANGYDESLLRLGRCNLTGLRQAWRSAAFTDSGILSTSEDVAEFTHLLFTGHFIQKDTVSRMLDTIDTQYPDLPKQAGYGLGVSMIDQAKLIIEIQDKLNLDD